MMYVYNAPPRSSCFLVLGRRMAMRFRDDNAQR